MHSVFAGPPSEVVARGKDEGREEETGCGGGVPQDDAHSETGQKSSHAK